MSTPVDLFTLGTGGVISATDATSYASASVTSTTGRVAILISAARRAAGEPNNPTASGHSLTWTRLTSVYVGVIKLSLFTAPVGTGATGTITVDFGGQTQDTHAMLYLECTADTASAIVQSITASTAASTTFTLTLGSALASDSNPVFYCTAWDVNNGAIRAEQGWLVPGTTTSPIINVPFRDAEGLALSMGWKAGNDTAAVITCGTSGAGAGIMIELRNATAIQAGSYSLSGTVTQDATPVSGATVRVIDRTTGDSKTTTTDVNGDWSISVASNTASRYAAMAEWDDAGTLYEANAPWSLTAA